MRLLFADRGGFAATWLAVTAPLLLLISALVLDMGRIIMVDQRLQIALDAAAHAATNPDAGEIFVYPTPVPIGQAPTFRAVLNHAAATTRARGVFNQSDLFQRPPVNPPVGVMGIIVTSFSVAIISESTAEVAASITVPTHIAGAVIGFFAPAGTAAQYRVLTVSGRARADTALF